MVAMGESGVGSQEPGVGRRYSGTISAMSATKITVINNGPIQVEGDFSIVDAEGREFGVAGRTVIKLWRCGRSDNKPFCDGHHGVTGFAFLWPAPELAT